MGFRRMSGRLAALLLLSVAAPALAKSPERAGKTPPPAPAFTLPTRNGVVSSDSLRGKVMLVDFWASWCGPCRQSFPWLKTLQERYAGKGLEIVAINLDKDRGAADAFLSQYAAPFTVAFDPSGKTAKAFHVWGMPSGFLVDPTGAILYSYVGFDPKDAGRVEARIEQAIPR